MEEDFNMSTPGVKVGVSEEEKKLAYYKYFEQMMNMQISVSA